MANFLTMEGSDSLNNDGLGVLRTDSKGKVSNSSSEGFFSRDERVAECTQRLSKYFHPEDPELTEKFKLVYKIFGLTDSIMGNECGVDRTTFSRYRRGIFHPTTDMKILISQTISKLSGFHFDSAILFGDSVYFERFKSGVEE